MEAHKEHLKTKDVTLDDILNCDAWARQHVLTQSENMRTKMFV
jgi:hypothetical protein